MYKVFLSFPDALRPAFPRLKEKLEDPDPGIFRLMNQFSHTKGVVDLPLVRRCPVGGGQRHLRAGQKESEELSQSGADLLQTDDIVDQQLDAHQNHQIGKK